MKNDKLYKFAHFLAGFVVILHGIGELDHAHGSPLFFFIAGLLMILVAAFHHRIQSIVGSGESILFFIEAAVQLFIVFIILNEVRKPYPSLTYLQLVCMFMLDIFDYSDKNHFGLKENE
ncbi:MAG: hypothetical protein IPK10_02480 [Bacteroidetes bacterium]|nr:hypothetical protein [Bacteroidota bacterium]